MIISRVQSAPTGVGRGGGALVRLGQLAGGGDGDLQKHLLAARQPLLRVLRRCTLFRIAPAGHSAPGTWRRPLRLSKAEKVERSSIRQ